MTFTTIGILEHFITHPPLKSPTPIGHHSPFLSNPPLSTPSQPWTTTELLSLRTCLFWTFHVNGILQHVVSRDGLLSQGIKFSRSMLWCGSVLHASLLPSQSLLYGLLHLACPLSWRIFGLLPLRAVVTRATVNVHLQAFVGTCVFIAHGARPRSGTARVLW